MKKVTIFFLLVFATTKTYAQDYQISFAGTGSSTTVDSVKVENLTQCTDTTLIGSDILYLTPTGIAESDLNIVKGNSLHIYPNPMTGNCSVDFEVRLRRSKTTLNLYDITGKRILQTQDLLSKGQHTYSLSGLSSGIYLLKIKSECEAYSYMAKIVSNNLSRLRRTEIKYIGITPSVDKQNTASNTTKTESAKSDKSLINMQYTTGDRLKITGKSGIYCTIFMLVPTQSQTVTFNFIDCTDADSNHYAVVQIGTQVWMAENLETTKYRDASSIPNVIDNTQWSNLTTGAYCHYNNDTNEGNIFGHLYNWYVVADSHNMCPVGWHVPADSEWTILTDCLGGEVVAGGKLKENCTTFWQSPNTGATNESGFSALPGGYCCDSNGSFLDRGHYGYWWASTEYCGAYASRVLYYNYADAYRYGNYERCGFSIRCVKD
ncbi:MAG: FISUMP domain-containing protein [bacterium]|nr:FISUMP domain-containing protein [bacterium]